MDDGSGIRNTINLLPTRDPKDEFDHKGTKDTRKTELEFPSTTGSKQPTEKLRRERFLFSVSLLLCVLGVLVLITASDFGIKRALFVLPCSHSFSTLPLKMIESIFTWRTTR
ncbi:MAG: hypothetical protein DMG05_11130 [Acidobacteria bacterium]|nr:MAG: hypothetical protein DMG05_11130 [Acidobacteriota bacterium]